MDTGNEGASSLAPEAIVGIQKADGGYRFANFDTAGFSTRLADGETGVMATIQQ